MTSIVDKVKATSGRIVRFALLAGTAGLFMACDGDDPKGHLLEATGTQVDRAAEEERLRQMQLLRVVDEDGGTHELDVHGVDFGMTLHELCDRCTVYTGSDPTCHQSVCRARNELCYGRTVLGIVTNPVALRIWMGDGYYSVPPQSAATNAALADLAIEHFWNVLTETGNATNAQCADESLAEAMYARPDQTTVSRAAFLGAGFIESYELAKQAYELQIKNSLAVADSELSTSPSLTITRPRAMSKRALSRSAVAHTMVGGPPGFFGSEDYAFCTNGRLDGPAQTALSVLRQAALPPADILDQRISTGALVNGNANAVGPSDGSVKDRLSELWGTTLANNQNVYDLYKLKEGDFDAARRSLVDEIKIYNRSTTAVLTRRRPNGTATGHKYYAATATAAPDRDDTYWMALALTESQDSTLTSGGDWRNGRTASAVPGTAGGGEYARYVDLALSWGTYIVEMSRLREGSADFVAEMQKSLLSPLTLALTTTERPGRITQCRDETKHEFAAYGYAVADGLHAVIGEDQLACATSGSVEGALCRVDLSLPFNINISPFRAFDVAARLDIPTEELPLGKRMYVIKPKVAGDTTAGPGQWEALVGFPVLSEDTTWTRTRCRDFPVVPEAKRAAKQALAPSRAWCGASQVTCAGADFDERLPLEDELTGDGDGIESSWKHYLSLAHDAAIESDRLGEEYISQSLARDQRHEDIELRRQAQQEKAAAALENLQDICGTAVDPIPLLKSLGNVTGGDFDLSKIDLGPCPEPDPETELPVELTPGTVCRSGRLVKDWLKVTASEPDLAKLADCVAQFTATTTMHLGDKALCAWKYEGTLCGGSFDGYRCPDVQPLNGACKVPEGTTAVPIPKEDGLHFFSTSDTLPPPTPETVCDTIRNLRKTPTDTGELGESLQAIVDSNFFSSAYLAQYRERIEFAATYGNFVELRVDKNVLATTGNAASGGGGANTTSWPCASAGRAVTCNTTGAGLFCDHYACNTADGLNQANLRLFRAAAAAQLTSFAGGDETPKFWVPSYLVNAQPDGGTNSNPLAFGVPLTRSANDNWQMFTGDVAANSPALKAHQLGRAYTLTEAFGSSTGNFAFSHVKPHIDLTLAVTAPPSLLQDFWGGMFQGEASTGYFHQLLTAGPQNLANPGAHVKVGFGRDVWVDEYASDSCTLSPWCDGDEQRNTRVKESLKDDHALATGNPIDEFYYSRHNPIIYAYDETSLADGLELMCEVAKGVSNRSVGCNLAEPPLLKGPKDLDRMGNYLSCLADEISTHAALQLFEQFPDAALDPLRESGTGPRPAVNGKMGDAVSALRSSLVTVASAGPAIGRAVKLFGEDMKRLKAILQSYDLDNQMADVEFEATAVQQLTNCLTSTIRDTAQIDGGNIVTLGSRGVALAAVACINSAAQIGFADTLRSLKQEKTQQERNIAAADFNQRFIEHNTELQAQSIALAGALETVDRQLGIIADLRHAAERAVNSAIWALTTHASNQAEITSTFGVRSEVAKARYVKAHDHAKHMAFLARRAIEQRLGIYLDEMTESMPLVDPPSTWASTLCTTSGVQYETLGSADTANAAVKIFADSYIGDYVDKLDRVVESYRLTKNFHEGTDTAIVSLRDDVFNVRAECAVESPNLLFFASELDQAANASPPIPRDYYTPGKDYVDEDPPPTPRRGWELAGCGVDTAGASLPNCITPLTHSDAPFVDIHPALRTVRGFKLHFGDSGSCPAATCGYRTDAYLGQNIALEPGRYRYSWYTPDVAGAAGDKAGFVSKGGTEVVPAHTGYQEKTDDHWARRYLIFDVAPATDGSPTATHVVGFKRPGTSNDVPVGAPMLERLDTLPNSRLEPKIFSNTTDTRTQILAICQDTDGSVFRQNNWKRHCIRLCPDGYSSDCRDRGTESCYWETDFHISQRGIETGRMFNQSGFARGNFNYRIDSIVPNFVGTSLRPCEDSETPQACHGAGFIPYSLIHDGPYYVRNDAGVDFQAMLFTGHIEHARGLGTERYITNPISDTDRGLLEPYTRLELQGRPLDGQFTLRVWEEQNVNFNAIEDVQLVLNYRYWTRFD